MANDDDVMILQAKTELNSLLERLRVFNEYCKIYQQAYAAAAKGELNETVLARNLEAFLNTVHIDLGDLGFAQIQDLVPNSFSDVRMEDLLRNATAHTDAIRPVIEEMVQNPEKISLGQVTKAWTEVNRGLEDLRRDKDKLQKPGQAGNYIVTNIFRMFENIALQLVKLSSMFTQDLNASYQQAFTEHEKSLTQGAVDVAGKFVSLFSDKGAKKLRKAAAGEDLGGSIQEKMAAETGKMNPHKRKR